MHSKVVGLFNWTADLVYVQEENYLINKSMSAGLHE